MKIGVVVPILENIDLKKQYEEIENSFLEFENVDFEVIFALNAKLNAVFTKIRSIFGDNSKVKAFMVDRPCNEHLLISVALKKCEEYDATILYSSKEDINGDVIKAFVTSWQAGNKIVYLRKIYAGFKKVLQFMANGIYKFGVKMLGVYKDMLAENDIQLLDNDVVLTLNQLPEKSRQLRTLDSFVGFSQDIVHLEVDSRTKPNPLFIEKDKDYYRNLATTLISLILCLGCVLSSVICLACGFEIPVYAHIILWFGTLGFLFMALIFNTRKRLMFRAGKQFEKSEIKALQDKIEYYNMF